jgi:hypothetical protein
MHNSYWIFSDPRSIVYGYWILTSLIISGVQSSILFKETSRQSSQLLLLFMFMSGCHTIQTLKNQKDDV